MSTPCPAPKFRLAVTVTQKQKKANIGLLRPMQNTLKRIRKKMYLIKTTLLFDELFLFKLELLTLSLEFLRSIKNEKLTLLLKAWKVTTKLPHWQWKYLLPETDGSGMSILGTTSRTQFIPFYQQLAFHFLIWLHLLPVHCVHWGLNYQTDWGVRDHCLSSHHCFSKKLPFKPWDISKCRTCHDLSEVVLAGCSDM